MMSKFTHEEIEEMLVAISDLPWTKKTVDDEGQTICITSKPCLSNPGRIVCDFASSHFNYPHANENAQFIVQAPQIIRQLLDENKLLRKTLDEANLGIKQVTQQLLAAVEGKVEE